MTADDELLDALRAGDEAAFRGLVERHHQSMVRVALAYVPSRAIAEEVAQETWLAVIEGIDRFEGRSSLKTWIFRILVNRARTRGVRESRTRPLSSLESDEADEPAVSADRFLERGHRWAGHWARPPEPWSDVPADHLAETETMQVIAETVKAMAPQQRQVITLRDVAGWSSEEVRGLLGLTDVNQRVLLHRARAKVRAALERHFDELVPRDV